MIDGLFERLDRDGTAVLGLSYIDKIHYRWKHWCFLNV